MTADEFVKIVRNGSDKLRVDDIVFGNAEKEFRGKGMLRISSERIEIEVTLNKGEKPPPRRTGIFTKSDFLKLRGIIEDRLEFRCNHVGPGGKSNEYYELQPTGSYDAIHKIIFRLHPIELIPTGLATLTTEERTRFYAQIRKDATDPTQGEQASEENSGSAIQFEAKLRDYPFFLGNELKGEMGNCDFTLAKEGETDLRVSLCSKKQYRSSSEEEDWRKFQALMDAMAFIHGTHAWPFRIEYWRGVRKVTDRVTAAQKLGRTAHAPFGEALEFNAKTGQAEWDYAATIRKVANFFEQASDIRNEIAVILFLFREAGNGVHSEITTLAMCTLFENLVNLLFKELRLKEKALQENRDLQLFEEARVEIAEQLALRTAEKGSGFERWQKVVRTTSLFTQREKFQAVVSHLGLKWEGDMELVFNLWKNARNPLVYETTRAERSEEQIKQSSIDESRIAGAINVIVLKLFGYTGLMRASVFEDQYRTI